MGAQGARGPRQIGLRRQGRQPRSTEYCGNRGFLADADFNHQMTAGSEQIACLFRNGAVSMESIGTAIQRASGIVSDFGRQRRDVATFDVGRIADDKVKGTGERSAEIANHELRA